MRHGHDGWKLAEYERAGDLGRFIYERKQPGAAKVEQAYVERPQPVAVARRKLTP
jgi:hypothetical protein